mgnify:CR=1 FL=1
MTHLPTEDETPVPGELLLYTSPDGNIRLDLRIHDETLWMTQQMMAELFQTSKQNIGQHIANILQEGELQEDGTVKKFFTVRLEGERQVKRSVIFYNLDMIISVGYRVNSIRGTQFRIWATQRLKEYMIKGFAIDDERLKNPSIPGTTPLPDYFDELLERIRDIRASEKRFYQKVRELFALSSDYDKTDQTTQVFFATVQNLLLYAVTQKTAAELIVSRANPADPHFGLLTWKGTQVRKQDILVAKNYLTEDEVDTLNRLVVIFLETAELRAKRQTITSMGFWRENVGQIVASNGFPLLSGAGSVSHVRMEKKLEPLYLDFDQRRKTEEARAADMQDEADLKALESTIKNRPKT